jgi:hypothetical protein
MKERMKKAEADAAWEKRQIDLLLKELENLQEIRGKKFSLTLFSNTV